MPTHDQWLDEVDEIFAANCDGRTSADFPAAYYAMWHAGFSPAKAAGLAYRRYTAARVSA
jgi:hypothetical protein